MTPIPWQTGARLFLETDRSQTAHPSALDDAVRRFARCDWEVQSTATLIVDQNIAIGGDGPRSEFHGDEIDALVSQLPKP